MASEFRGRLPKRILDSHFHIFRAAEVPDAGLTSAPKLRRDFAFADYRAAWDGLPVVGGVMVQVRDEADGLAEAADIAREAAGESGIAAMVGGNPVEESGRRAELDTLRANPLVRGIRRGTQFHPDPLYLARPELIAGFRRVAELGLVPEVCVKHFQLDGVIALADALPDTTLVLDHLGKPELVAGDQPQWRRRMAELARHPGVVVKVSVILQQPDDPPLPREAVRPIVRQVVELFGWDRVLFGSNWPVSTLVVGYRDWVELLLDAFSDATDDELDRLFYRNAARVWRTPNRTLGASRAE